ncbi:hypothetical protein [Actinophytocola oryzae]|uniref:hypothetical protein n=1 Tax=Actinophytocola oryzae TaxID=502181 RepID=UPI0010640044|nr:hypothetical protein [Actinophytocola oryzae]
MDPATGLTGKGEVAKAAANDNYGVDFAEEAQAQRLPAHLAPDRRTRPQLCVPLRAQVPVRLTLQAIEQFTAGTLERPQVQTGTARVSDPV